MSYGADTPALDFCRKVQTWQGSAANQTAGLVVIMNEREEDTLGRILSQAACGGSLARLENEARLWLVGYRELEDEQRVLTTEQRDELIAITNRIKADYRQQPQMRRKPLAGPWLASIPRLIIIAVACLLLGLGLAGLAAGLYGTGSSSPPPAGAPQNPGEQGPQPGPLTDQQQFRVNWNVPAAATADAGNPAALVLLQDGLYYVTPWELPAGDSGWQAGTSGGVSAAVVHGNQADVTDSDGNAWTVAVGQPFALSSNPQVIYRITERAIIQTMDAGHAIVIRHRL
jgi:hypothetical protein